MSSSVEIVDRPSTLQSPSLGAAPTTTTTQQPTKPSPSTLIYNYFTTPKIKQSPSTASSTTPNTLLSSTTTNNSCSSNTSSNSSSFIQLSNDDTLESVTIPPPASLNVQQTPIIHPKHKKLVKKLNKKKLKFKQQQRNKIVVVDHSNKFILNAFVNGFAQLKLCADKIDYEYIIEIYWSNSMKTFIKRTYDDFVLFHRKLMQIFVVNNKIQYNFNNKNNLIDNNNNNNNSNNQQKIIPTLPGLFNYQI
jgi:hypothetical protein